MKLFSCYEKRLHSPFLPLHRQNKEVWVSGLNQHTANVPNRKVPKVRILLLPHIGSLAQLDQSTTLRTSVSGVRVSHESHNIGGLAELVYCTSLENRQAATSQRFESFSLRKLALSHNGSAADSGSASGGSIPSGATSVRSFGRLGVCAGLKIPKTWFDSTRLHLKIRECSSGNEGGL